MLPTFTTETRRCAYAGHTHGGKHLKERTVNVRWRKWTFDVVVRLTDDKWMICERPL